MWFLVVQGFCGGEGVLKACHGQTRPPPLLYVTIDHCEAISGLLQCTTTTLSVVPNVATYASTCQRSITTVGEIDSRHNPLLLLPPYDATQYSSLSERRLYGSYAST